MRGPNWRSAAAKCWRWWDWMGEKSSGWYLFQRHDAAHRTGTGHFNRPDLLLLDELVSGLDPVGQRDMRDLLRQLKAEGMSIFLNSHQLADVEALCDRVAIINEGRILKVGAPQALFDEFPVFEVRVNPVSKELLHRLGAVALAVQQDEDDPCLLYIEVHGDEQAADIAEVVHACGSRLYGLAPHDRSLEQLFLRTIDASRHRTAVESHQL